MTTGHNDGRRFSNYFHGVSSISGIPDPKKQNDANTEIGKNKSKDYKKNPESDYSNTHSTHPDYKEDDHQIYHDEQYDAEYEDDNVTIN